MAESRLQQEHPFPGDTVPKYRYKFFPVFALNGWAAATVGSGAGSPIVGENTTSSITGLRIQANADSFAFLWAIPDDVDVNAPIDISIWWSSNQTTVADSYTWTILYDEIAVNSTDGADTAATTVLNTALVADANLVTASALQKTEYGTINGGNLSGTIADGYQTNVLVTATTNATDVASDLVIWYGFEIRYMPRKV